MIIIIINGMSYTMKQEFGGGGGGGRIAINKVERANWEI